MGPDRNIQYDLIGSGQHDAHSILAVTRRRAGFRGSPLPRGFRSQSLIAVAACDSDEYTSQFLSNQTNPSTKRQTCLLQWLKRFKPP